MIGCKGQEPNPPSLTDNLNSLNKPDKPAVWLVDWSMTGSVPQAELLANYLGDIMLFGAYFNPEGHVFIVENSRLLIDNVKKSAHFSEDQLYLTITNDQFTADGKVIQKNPDILYNIWESEEAVTNHIESIITLISTAGIKHVEIDYEQIPDELIPEFYSFINQLNDRLNRIESHLRVVLEPSFPVESYPLPEDINFTVMTYNLHGPHTVNTPGPKTDYQLLESLTKKYKPYEEQVGFALSNGGFLFTADDVIAINESVIDHQLMTSKKPTRDRSSDALSTNIIYNNQQGELWYADQETLLNWYNFIQSQGDFLPISLWRLGDISKESENFIYTISPK